MAGSGQKERGERPTNSARLISTTPNPSSTTGFNSHFCNSDTTLRFQKKKKIVPSIVTSRLVTPRSNLSNPVPSSLRACSACLLLSRDCRHGYKLAGIYAVCAKYRYWLHVHVQWVQRGSPSPNKHQPPHPPPRPMQRQEGPHQQLKRDISSLSPHWFSQGALSSSAVDPVCVPAHTTN